MLRLVLVILMAYLASVILAGMKETPHVLIDGYIVNDSFTSAANLSLGTTIVLICRINGMHNDKDTFDWECPNDKCDLKFKGYDGRDSGVNVEDGMKENFLAINITSVKDSGRYTCKYVSVKGSQGYGYFDLTVTGGEVVHSYGRLILNEKVISHKRQLKPTNNTKKKEGMIECEVMNSSRKAWFTHYGLNDTHPEVEVSVSRFNYTAVTIKRGALRSKKFAIEGHCANLYHYLFLEEDAYCLNLDKNLNITRSYDSITVTINKLPCGIARAIVGYTKLVHGVWVQGEYVNLRECETKTFSSLDYDKNYTITAWGLSGGDTDNRRRCQSPTVRTYNLTHPRTMPQRASSPPRALVVIGDGNKAHMSWIYPKDPNGYIMHFKIKIKHDGKYKEVITAKNSYTLEGMKAGETYYITVIAVHEDGLEGESSLMEIYVHDP